MPGLNTDSIKQRAQELGFAACGIARVEESATHRHYERWLENGYQAGMGWIAREDAVWKRSDPRHVLPGARSMVCVAMHYRTENDWDETEQGKVARYARGTDYHEFMPKRLRELLEWIQQQQPCQGRVYVDTGPILEREWAQRAGLGWIGKNSMLLSRELGSYFLLGEILLDIPLEPDRPHIEQFCGTCTRCMDACPTGAITEPRVVDANKCISYQTIENRDEIPEPLKENFEGWIFGCDICQEVCPWNNKSSHHSEESELWQREAMPTLLEWLMLPQEEYSRRLSKSPLKRPKLAGMKRNAEIALSARKAPIA